MKEKQVVNLVKSKGKKNAQKLIKFQNIKESIKKAVLKRYFDKCKAKYNSKFFEWRKQKKKLDIEVWFLI